MDDGLFTFVAWEDNPEFTVTFEMSHPLFCIKKNESQSDDYPEVMSVIVGDQTNVKPDYSIDYIAPYPTFRYDDSHVCAAGWSVFEAYDELFHLTASEFPSFSVPFLNVYFNCWNNNNIEMGSNCCLNSDCPAEKSRFGVGVYLRFDNRFDWDVAGHEFGHYVAANHSIAQIQGGFHDGSNQYCISANDNADTFHNKEKSLRLAFSEGYATFFSVSLFENCRPEYKKIKGVGDTVYDPHGIRLEPRDGSLGEDCEFSVARILWDLYDGSQDGYFIGSMTDSSPPAGLVGMWNRMQGKYFSNIWDFWSRTFPEPHQIPYTAPTLVEMGISPWLHYPSNNSLIDMEKPLYKDIEFRWDANFCTGDLFALQLNTYRLLIYTDDFAQAVWMSIDTTELNMKFTESDRQLLLAQLPIGYDGDLMVVVYGWNDGSRAASGGVFTGPYPSNAVRIIPKRYKNYYIVGIDSTTSNLQTDPGNLRIAKAKTLINSWTSFTEAENSVCPPDLVAVYDFDTEAHRLCVFEDPDLAASLLDPIDSNGNTMIDSVIDAGLSLCDTWAPFLPNIYHRTTMYIFTDGWNNAGMSPVYSAMWRAFTKGVHTYLTIVRVPSTPKTSESDPACPKKTGSVLDEVLAGLVLDTGGYYAEFDSAEGYGDYVEALIRRGTSRLDEPSDRGGTEVVRDSVAADRIGESFSLRSNRFFGIEGDSAQVAVQSSAFNPEVWIIDAFTGEMIASEWDEDVDGKTELTAVLPSTGFYYCIVKAPGNETGFYSIALHGVGACYSPVITGATKEVQTCAAGEPVALTVTATGTTPLD